MLQVEVKDEVRAGCCPRLTRYQLIGLVFILSSSLIYMISIRVSEHWVRVRASSRTSSLVCASYIAHQRLATVYTHVNSPGDRRGHLTFEPNASRHSYFPSALVIGARKAGTRALLRFINLHPDVVISAKELHYFDSFYEKSFDWYRRQMPLSLPHQLTIEKTPNYFVDLNVPKRVYHFNPSIKLILVVRNPIDRAVSDYVQLKFKLMKKQQKKRLENGTIFSFGDFEDYIFVENTSEVNKSYAPIKRSLYSCHLERWLTYFRLSQILVVDGENLKVKPWEETQKVETFLHLQHQVKRDQFVYNQTKRFFCIKGESKLGHDLHLTSPRCLADSKGRQHPKLRHGTRKILRNFFQPFNSRFFSRIGRKFNWS
ncbi:heparan sulfate glucosamine 3-O-sulfotransferase 1-like [Physella acuta]|uniref:heparan sulfate glucosamine 3-O-sulfotransferase 1-like n=1 Tax=Physella acuta TaxID=109671 RepID=UPI0027DD8A0D|nr:heparan sulfate glucosamine 3-O-sulfotransferase 1-like [Physella acuta]